MAFFHPLCFLDFDILKSFTFSASSHLLSFSAKKILNYIFSMTHKPNNLHPSKTYFFSIIFHPFSSFPNHISLNIPIIAFRWKQRSVTKKNCKKFYTILINGKIENKES